ncbi:MAG: hypothetical protein AAFY78_18355 [Cyanobacteria bacterium J06648_16]
MTSGSPLSRDERSLAMACHLLSLAGYVMPSVKRYRYPLTIRFIE